MNKPKVIDLFAGVGGMSLGFEQKGFEIVLANENDLVIADSYKKNHKNTEVITDDITQININKVFSKYKGKVDVVIGGPPCQGFSQKGMRRTINDDRNFLFKRFVDVVKMVKPKYFVMENVPNLLTAGNGYFKREIESLFRKIGYKLNMDVYNAAEYGVPQNRRRAIIIGKLNAKAPRIAKKTFKKNTIWDAISDLAYLDSGEGSDEQKYRCGALSSYQKKLRKNSKVLFNHIATKHTKLALKRLELIPPNSGKEKLPKEHLTKSIYSGTWTRMRKDDISVTITTRFDTPSSGKFTHPFLNRAITVREAARIQSFPDTFRFYGNKSSQMKQVGNAVPPMMAAEIAYSIIRDMEADND